MRYPTLALRALAVAATFVCLTAISSWATAAPVFQYSFPASFDGTGTTVTDLSTAGNNGNINNAVLNAAIPPGAPAGNQSIDTRDGGATTQAIDLLENATVAAAGGFLMSTDFRWDGTNDDGSNILIQKLIDYAGTEFIQIENLNLTGGTADLRFGFNDAPGGPTMAINANTWYHVDALFLTNGAAVAGDGSLSGTATLSVTDLDAGSPTVTLTEAATKTDFGDSLDRVIGIGALSVAPTIIELHGQIHDPSVSLIPEPTSLVLLAAGGLLLASRCRRMAG